MQKYHYKFIIFFLKREKEYKISWQKIEFEPGSGTLLIHLV